MEVYIGTERLDMPAQDISIHTGRIRFGRAFGDDYSTDIEVPKTAKNLRLLTAYMVAEGSHIGVKTPASILVGSVTEDGYVMVASVGRDTMTITVFIARLPSELMDKRLGEIISDDDTTTIQWDDLTSAPAPSAAVGLWPYYQGADIPSIVPIRLCKPSIKLWKVLSMVTEATGVNIDIDTVGEVTLTPTKMLESPASKIQVLTKKSMTEKTRRGSSYYSVPEDENSYGVQFTCEADITVSLYLVNPTMASGSVDYIVDVIDGSGIHQSIIAQQVSIQHAVRHFTARHHVRTGDKLRLAISLNGGAQDDVQTAVTIEYSNISNVSAEEHALTFYRHQQIGNLTFCHQNFGIITNLADITMRDLLTSVAWYFGKVVKVTPNSVSFVDSTINEISGNVTELNSAAGTLAKTITITDASDRVILSHDVDGDYLESDKSMHKSSFFVAQRRSADMYQANIPEFTISDDGSLSENKISGIPISIPRTTAADNPPIGRCLRPTSVNSGLLVTPTRALGAVIETFDDVAGADFVTIDQHTYAVVDSDKDLNSGLTTINAILI